MLKQLLEGAATRLLRIFQLAAELGGRAPDDNHFVLRSGKRPLGISGRHVFAGNIGSLVTGVAAHSVNTQAILAVLYIMQMRMPRFTLLPCATRLSARFRRVSQQH